MKNRYVSVCKHIFSNSDILLSIFIDELMTDIPYLIHEGEVYVVICKCKFPPTCYRSAVYTIILYMIIILQEYIVLSFPKFILQYHYFGRLPSQWWVNLHKNFHLWVALGKHECQISFKFWPFQGSWMGIVMKITSNWVLSIYLNRHLSCFSWNYNQDIVYCLLNFLYFQSVKRLAVPFPQFPLISFDEIRNILHLIIVHKSSEQHLYTISQ